MNKQSRVWSLQEAKAKFSEVFRRAHEEGPQTVTKNGKEAVTISAQSPSQVGVPTVDDLVKAMQSCPDPNFGIPRRPRHAKFRDVKL